jgi:hypothetical protein
MHDVYIDKVFQCSSPFYRDSTAVHTTENGVISSFHLVVVENCALLESRCVIPQNSAVLDYKILSITCSTVGRQLSTQVCHNPGLPSAPGFVVSVISLGTKEPAEYAAGININVHFYQATFYTVDTKRCLYARAITAPLTYIRLEVQLHSLVSSALVGGQCHDLCLDRLPTEPTVDVVLQSLSGVDPRYVIRPGCC